MLVAGLLAPRSHSEEQNLTGLVQLVWLGEAEHSENQQFVKPSMCSEHPNQPSALLTSLESVSAARSRKRSLSVSLCLSLSLSLSLALALALSLSRSLALSELSCLFCLIFYSLSLFPSLPLSLVYLSHVWDSWVPYYDCHVTVGFLKVGGVGGSK